MWMCVCQQLKFGRDEQAMNEDEHKNINNEDITKSSLKKLTISVCLFFGNVLL